MKQPWWKRKKKDRVIDPDEIFLDAGNLPEFEVEQFEGVMERPIKSRLLLVVGFVFTFLGAGLLLRVYMLQVVEGDAYHDLARVNSLEHSVIFAERGVIYDRTGKELVWNSPYRIYSQDPGLAHALGYVSLPFEDEITEEGYHPQELVGRAGVERLFDDDIRGEFGLKIVEVDVGGNVLSESVLSDSREGENVALSIDARVQTKLYKIIERVALERGFQGGSGVVMDVSSGEVVAMANFPEYDPNVLAKADDELAITALQQDERKPFLNRALQGLYTPGSIFKPFVAVAALTEGIITPEKVIVTNGELRVLNPYDPGADSVFRDWKNHGPVNLIDALAVSSNVYFFEIGGGFRDQSGLGIEKIAEYARVFGFGSGTGAGFQGEAAGLVPTPAWKEQVEGEPWRIGDTYNTSIGQYSFQVTPMQVARAVAAIANDGKLLTPSFIKSEAGRMVSLKNVPAWVFETVKTGMREAVLRGTASGLYMPELAVAAKTGTAEIDFSKTFVNSWVMGFFPAHAPRYAFALVMERGPRENFIGGVFVMRELLTWMVEHAPEYAGGADTE